MKNKFKINSDGLIDEYRFEGLNKVSGDQIWVNVETGSFCFVSDADTKRFFDSFEVAKAWAIDQSRQRLEILESL